MFEGRVGIITGGARGIGVATAKRLLAGGASVSLWDLERSPELDALESEFGERVQFCEVDVRDYNKVRVAAGRCGKTFERVDILVNNAGVTFGFVSLADTTDEVMSAIVGTNVEGTVNCTRAVMTYFRRTQYGRIVNSTSLLGRFGIPGQTAYAASKSAIEGLTRVWAQEFGSIGVTVNAVSPGYIDTRMNEANGEEMESYVVQRTPVGRIGTADEVARVTAFLASEESAFLTGVVVPVDGGYIP